MAVARFQGFLTSEIIEPWNQATRPETLAHIAAEYGTTADRLVRHTVVEVPETVLTKGIGPLDAFPVPRRLHSSDDGEPCRLRGFPGLGRPLGDLGLSSGDRTPTAFLGACMDPTGQTGSGLRQRIAALHGDFAQLALPKA